MQILTKDGFKDFSGFVKSGKSTKIYNISLSNGSNIKCTPEHKILMSNNTFKCAEKLKKKNILFNDVKILNIQTKNESIDVFDAINVADIHSFRANGIEVHNCLICDEFAFVQPNLAEEFWASNYPTISASKKSKIIIISTPNGLFNLFHRLWVGAENERNNFVHVKINWRDVPGRDEEWAKNERSILGDQGFQQEHEVAFLGSTSTLINPTVLETLLNLYEQPKEYELEGKFRIYEKPIEGAQYVCGVDVGEGAGQDDSVVQVFKIINKNPIQMEQVATYSSNVIETHVFAEVVNRIALYYNDAYIMCERNAIGDTVVSKIWYEYGNMNLINYTAERAKKGIGIRATGATKPKACLLMKRLIEFGNMKLRDEKTIEELAAFVEEKGKYFGKTMHDDMVTAVYWAAFIIETKVLDDVSLGKNVIGEESKMWGILADYENQEENWNWLTNDMFN